MQTELKRGSRFLLSKVILVFESCGSPKEKLFQRQPEYSEQNILLNGAVDRSVQSAGLPDFEVNCNVYGCVSEIGSRRRCKVQQNTETQTNKSTANIKYTYLYESNSSKFIIRLLQYIRPIGSPCSSRNHKRNFITGKEMRSQSVYNEGLQK